MKYGPISAAISAMIKAIANPSSVVCTVSPLEQVPSHWRPGTAHAPARRNQRRSSAIYRANCGEVTATSRDGFARTRSPACGQPFEATQDEGRPPFRILGVVEAHVRDAAQQARDRDLCLDTRQLGAEAKVNAPAEGQRTHIGPVETEAIPPL